MTDNSGEQAKFYCDMYGTLRYPSGRRVDLDDSLLEYLSAQQQRIADLEQELQDWKDGADLEAQMVDERGEIIRELKARIIALEQERDEAVSHAHQYWDE